MEAGIRNRVEIWADGGYRHAHDIVKLHCMGANRVAFGTLAMVSLGCTICRGCQLDTCHVGIATQIETVEQAQEHGLKKFTPQAVDTAAETCARFFQSMGEEVKEVVGSLGYERAQDLVGRYDLLEQISHHEQIDLAPLITPLEEFLDLEPIDLPVAEEALVEARAEAGLVRAKPIRMEPKAGLAPRSPRSPTRSSTGSCVSVEFPRPTDAHDRVLGTELSGAIARARIYDGRARGHRERRARRARPSTAARVAGQGFGAFNEWGVTCRVEGGAQDGVGKTMLGGIVSILKGKNAEGERVNGSVGKSFAYGAQRGRLFVQGSADSRFCIRLSGRRRRARRRARGAARRLPRLHRRPRQRQGLRLRVHDLGPRRRARRHRPLGLRRHDRRPRLRPRQRRVEPRPRRDRAPPRRGRQGRSSRRSTPRASSTSRTCSATTPTSCAPPTRPTRPTASTALVADAKTNFLMIIPEKVQADPSISTE